MKITSSAVTFLLAILMILQFGCSAEPTSPSDIEFSDCSFSYEIKQNMIHEETRSNWGDENPWTSEDFQKDEIEFSGKLEGNTFKGTSSIDNSTTDELNNKEYKTTIEFNEYRTKIIGFSLTRTDTTNFFAPSTNRRTTYKITRSISGGTLERTLNQWDQTVIYRVLGEETCNAISASKFTVNNRIEYKDSDGNNQWILTMSNSQNQICDEDSYVIIEFW